MIAACPSCQAQYRIEDARIGPGGARLRCARCRGLFRVPAAGTAPAHSGSRVPAPGRTQPVASSPVRWDSEFEAGPGAVGQLLLADANPVRAQETAACLTGMGMYVVSVRDGVEALLNLQRMLTPVVILAADLPCINGGDLCEIIKRSEGLRTTGVVLLGPHPLPGGAARPVKRAHEPDLQLDRVEPNGPIVPFLKSHGLYTPGPSAGLVADTARDALGVDPEPSLAGLGQESTPILSTRPAGLDGERAKAERLARIVVSDMLLYHPERFDLAADEKSLLEEFGPEVQEGFALLSKRVDESVLSERDYLVEELLRVARQRAKA